MAKKKNKNDKNNKDKKVEKKKKSKGLGPAIFVFIVLGGVIFLPTTIVLVVGMLPSFVVFFVDRSKKKTKAITVGSMNLAGCSLFLMEMWIGEHSLTQAFTVIMNPMAVIVMYSAACVGYLIDWSVTGVVSSLLYQRGLSRQKDIVKREADLIERWGVKVAGDVLLDEEGFSLEPEKKKAPEKKK